MRLEHLLSGAEKDRLTGIPVTTVGMTARRVLIASLHQGTEIQKDRASALGTLLDIAPHTDPRQEADSSKSPYLKGSRQSLSSVG